MGKPRKTGKKKPDQKRIRTKTSDKLSALLSEVTALEGQEQACTIELKQFHECDYFQFQQWMEENYSEEQKELQKIVRETEIYEEALEVAETAFSLGNFTTFEEALLHVEEEIRKDFEDDSWSDEEFDRDEEDNEASSDAGRPEEESDFLFRSFLEEVKGLDPETLDQETRDRYRTQFEASFEHATQGDFEAFAKSMLRLAGEDPQSDQSAAKVVFRRLVRRLHPDHHPEFGEREKALWNQAMACYKEFDTAGLELVELRLCILLEEKITPSQTPILRRYRDRLKFLVEEMRFEIRDATDHPAWNFSIKRKAKASLRKMAKEFNEALTEARERLAELTSLFTDATRATKRRQKRSPAKSAPSSKKAKAPAKKATKPTKKSARRATTAAAKQKPSMTQEEFSF
ncbi:MAG: hypothetical protein KA250_02040 [Verrucomicrobiales bacterium]|jgi:hypothetical protein|nr:hypothetical protein [Verrucomicrobiales bacterium]